MALINDGSYNLCSSVVLSHLLSVALPLFSSVWFHRPRKTDSNSLHQNSMPKTPHNVKLLPGKHFVNQVCARTVEHSVKKRKLNIQIKWEMNKFGAQRIFPTCFFFSFSCETIKLLYRTMPLSICWILFSFRLYFCSCD